MVRPQPESCNWPWGSGPAGRSGQRTGGGSAASHLGGVRSPASWALGPCKGAGKLPSLRGPVQPQKVARPCLLGRRGHSRPREWGVGTDLVGPMPVGVGSRIWQPRIHRGVDSYKGGTWLGGDLTTARCLPLLKAASASYEPGWKRALYLDHLYNCKVNYTKRKRPNQQNKACQGRSGPWQRRDNATEK